MTNKALARIMLRVDKALLKAVQAALSEIEKEARKALEASPATLKGFCIAGDSASFHVVSQGSGGEHIPPGDLSKHGLVSPHAEVVAKLLYEYEWLLRLIKVPIQIKRSTTGELIKI